MAKTVVRTKQTLQVRNFLELGLIGLYLLVHFISDYGSIDMMGPQWFYLAVIDGLALIYFLVNKNTYAERISEVLRNPLTIAFCGFFLWAGGSYFYAINNNEMLVCYSRMITTMVAFINISVFLKGREDYFQILAFMISTVLCWETLSVINKFLDGINSDSIDQVILAASGNTGNKNIIAASIAIKIPFAIYFLHHRNTFIQFLGTIILFMGFYALFILNARATLVGLGLLTILYLIFILFSDRSKENRISKFKPLGFYFFCMLSALVLSIIVFKNIQEKTEVLGNYDNPLKRIGTITPAKEGVRTTLWKWAFDYFQHHPIIGAGYGNWKLASIPYEKFFSNDFIVAYHCHNDFFETLAELGIIGLLLYASLYLIIFITQLKKIINKQATPQQRILAAVGIFCLTAYFVDASFNFPVERPIMQINFAFMAAQIFLFPSPQKTKKSFDILFFLMPALLFTTIAVMINNQVFNSMKGQRLFAGEMQNELEQLSNLEYDFPTYPQLCYNTIPIDAIMARYEFKKNNYDKAINMLDRASRQNPYIHYDDFTKTGLYYKLSKPDSAYKYAKITFENKPRSFGAYKNWLYVSTQKKDSLAIDSAFRIFTKYRNEPTGWVNYFDATMAIKQRANARLISLVDSALKKFPDNQKQFTDMKNNMLSSMNVPARNTMIITPEMVQIAQKNLTLADAHFKEKKFELAAKEYLITANIDTKNYVHAENVGLCYLSLSNYDQAIKYFNRAIAVSGNNSAKSLYYKGVSEILKGIKEKGCNTIKSAIAKGFQGDVNFNKANCNF